MKGELLIGNIRKDDESGQECERCHHHTTVALCRTSTMGLEYLCGYCYQKAKKAARIPEK